MTEEDLTSGLYTHKKYMHTSLYEYMLIPHKHVHITHTHTSIIICVSDFYFIKIY